ncbi:hypothetical protein SLA2020_316890 [Shorea laevis]
MKLAEDMVGLFKPRQGGFSHHCIGASFLPRGKEPWGSSCSFLGDKQICYLLFHSSILPLSILLCSFVNRKCAFLFLGVHCRGTGDTGVSAQCVHPDTG